MNIVEFSDGTFGVKRECGFLVLKWEKFLSHDGNWWYLKHNVHSFCKFKTLEEAKEAMVASLCWYTDVPGTQC